MESGTKCKNSSPQFKIQFLIEIRFKIANFIYQQVTQVDGRGNSASFLLNAGPTSSHLASRGSHPEKILWTISVLFADFLHPAIQTISNGSRRVWGWLPLNQACNFTLSSIFFQMAKPISVTFGKENQVLC
jgi:hypothetical protein